MSILISSFCIFAKFRRLKTYTYAYLYFNTLDERFLYRNRMIKSLAHGRSEFAYDTLGLVQTCFMSNIGDTEALHVVIKEETNTPYRVTDGETIECRSLQELKDFEQNVFSTANDKMRHICLPLSEQNKLLKDILCQLTDIKQNQESINSKLFTLSNRVDYLERRAIKGRQNTILRNQLVIRRKNNNKNNIRSNVTLRQSSQAHITL